MTAMRVLASQRVLQQSSQMGFRTMNMATRPLMGAMGTSTPQRAFSLPEHLVMEMPNLSPTMEKVSSHGLSAKSDNIHIKRIDHSFACLLYRETSSSGTSKLVTRSRLAML